MSMEVKSLLSSSPEIRDGRPCINGTGISVHRIAILHNLGHSPDEIVRKYKHLTIAGVTQRWRIISQTNRKSTPRSRPMKPMLPASKGNFLVASKWPNAHPIVF